MSHPRPKLEMTYYTVRSLGAGIGSFIGHFIDEAGRDFGSALEVIDLHVAHTEPLPTYQEALDMGLVNDFTIGSFTKEAGPPLDASNTVRFERKRKRLRISHVARHVTAAEAFTTLLVTLTRDIYHRAFQDITEALERGLSARIKASDDFDTAGYLAHVAALQSMSFDSDEAMRDRLQQAAAVWAEREKARDPWEWLEIDWSRMAPAAREILDDPEDWSVGYEFAPHGNDCGADVWADWETFQKLTPAKAGHRMELPAISPDLPDYLWMEWVHLYLALCFGHIKKSGTCPTDLNRETRTIIATELEMNTSRDWVARDEWAKRLDRYRGILRSLDTHPSK